MEEVLPPPLSIPLAGSPLERPLSPPHPDATSPHRVSSPRQQSQLGTPTLNSGATRPPLRRANTSGAGSASGGSAGCRLLWRGKLFTHDGQDLHGIAVIAHLFSLSSTASPHLTPSSSSVDPFDDPFASSASLTSSGADMCLGLEMLRSGDIKVKGEVGIKRKGDESPMPALTKKGKGKAKEEEERIEVETPTDVRIYIDERCPETVEWFQDMFCREGREGMGIKLDAGGEEVIIFASYPPQPSEQENVDPTASTSALPPLPPLTLLLGRPSRSAVRKPRPDDPMPRENLFTKKLRKTASLPAAAFSLSSSTTTTASAQSTKPPKVKRQTAKDKAIASLLSANNIDVTSSRPKVRHASGLPPSMAFPPPPLPSQSSKSRALSRSTSSARLFSHASSSSTSRAVKRESSLPPLSSTSRSRRNSLAAPSNANSASRSFQRSTSRSSMLLDSPPGSEDEVEEAETEVGGRIQPLRFNPPERNRANSRGPSPTPSIASTCFGLEADDRDGDDNDNGDFGEESQDAVAQLRSFAATANRTVSGRRANGGAGGGMTRSSSLPVGQFALGAAVAATSASREREEERARKRRREEREGTALPPSTTTIGGRASSVGPTTAATVPAGEVETRNKNTVKKMTLNRLTALGLGKDHLEFRDVFSFTTRGVGFSMRSTFKVSVLSAAERQRAEELVEQHLQMYLAPSYLTTSSTFFPFPTPTPEPDSAMAATSVKPEPDLPQMPSSSSAPTDFLPSLPSPKSLGDGLEASFGLPDAQTGNDDDVEMAETQLVGQEAR
ncbi:hypothetical protein JCM11641_004829 [Rhodosporidiobolus odoratus]